VGVLWWVEFLIVLDHDTPLIQRQHRYAGLGCACRVVILSVGKQRLREEQKQHPVVRVVQAGVTPSINRVFVTTFAERFFSLLIERSRFGQLSRSRLRVDWLRYLIRGNACD